MKSLPESLIQPIVPSPFLFDTWERNAPTLWVVGDGEGEAKS